MVLRSLFLHFKTKYRQYDVFLLQSNYCATRLPTNFSGISFFHFFVIAGPLGRGDPETILVIMKLSFDNEKQLVLPRKDFKDVIIDTEGKSIIIGFNEPKFKKSQKDLAEGDLDSKLNARFITYFLPAVEVSRMQKKRLRFFIVSGLNMALKWNAQNEQQKAIMMASDALKFDFLKTFFDKFFPNDFSLVEYIVPQDILKVPETKFLALWRLIEKKYPDELKEIRFQLTKFLYPKQFNARSYNGLSLKQREDLKRVDASTAFQYAIGHLFALGDINFEGNYVHTPNGYVSIGGEYEVFFNKVRDVAYDTLKDFGEMLFDREVIVKNNYRIVLQNKFKVPPPYNGMFREKELLEVTYENGKSLDYYNTQTKVQDQLHYMYDNLLSKVEYQKFWDSYRPRYLDLKTRYKEAYNIRKDW